MNEQMQTGLKKYQRFAKKFKADHPGATRDDVTIAWKLTKGKKQPTKQRGMTITSLPRGMKTGLLDLLKIDALFQTTTNTKLKHAINKGLVMGVPYQILEDNFKAYQQATTRKVKKWILHHFYGRI